MGVDAEERSARRRVEEPFPHPSSYRGSLTGAETFRVEASSEQIHNLRKEKIGLGITAVDAGRQR